MARAPEGTTLGTPFDIAALQGIEVPVVNQSKFYDVWGSPQTTPHTPAMVGF